MPTVDDLKSSKFLTKNDVEPPIRVTIDRYKEQNVAMENQPEEMKYTLYFKEVPKPLVLNITNGKLIQIVTGSGDLNDWVGKQIVLYNDPTVSFAGELTGGIRVQVPQPQVPEVTNPDYVGDDPPPPTDKDIPF
jgi:hypothetical protein